MLATISPTLADDDSQASALAIVAIDLPPVWPRVTVYTIFDWIPDRRTTSSLLFTGWSFDAFAQRSLEAAHVTRTCRAVLIVRAMLRQRPAHFRVL